MRAALDNQHPGFSVDVRIVDEAEARRFNCTFRNRDYATNVLSFPAQLPAGLPEAIQASVLGDLMICAPLVALEALDRQRPEVDHWAHMTVHGVLHLLGYDHEDTTQAQQMEALEIKILAGLGIPDPYEARC